MLKCIALDVQLKSEECETRPIAGYWWGYLNCERINTTRVRLYVVNLEKYSYVVTLSNVIIPSSS